MPCNDSEMKGRHRDIPRERAESNNGEMKALVKN